MTAKAAAEGAVEQLERIVVALRRRTCLRIASGYPYQQLFAHALELALIRPAPA